MPDAIVKVVENRAVVTPFGSELIGPLVDEAQSARDEAVDASTTAQLAAASALAAGRYFPSKAAGEAGSATGELFASSDGSGNLIYWERTSGASIEIARAVTPVTLDDYATLDGAETLSGKTFSGQTQVHTNGGRIGFTDAEEPLSAIGGLVHVVNGAEDRDGSNTGSFRVTSYWEGSTAAPYQNNDTTLFETFNRVESDSSNFSWSVSAAQQCNDIPDGVTDSGQRIGVLGWAVSVDLPGYRHAGTMNIMMGVRGRAGFQGPGSTGHINEAIGVRGEIYNDAVADGSTIGSATAGEFLSNKTGVETSYAVRAVALNGSAANWSFHGDAGKFFNQEQALFRSKSSEMPSAISARGTGPTIEFGFPATGGYGGSLGCTVDSGRPYIGWSAEAHTSGDTYTTRGLPGYVAFTTGGNLIFGRVPLANAANQAMVEAFRLQSDGRALFSMGPNSTGGYRVSGLDVVGARGAAVPNAAVSTAAPTKAEFDALVGTVNTLLARLRAHGLIAT